MIVRLFGLTIVVIRSKHMPSIADLSAAVSAVQASASNVSAQAAAYIASTSNPVPQSIIDNLNATKTSLDQTAVSLTPPPQP